MPQPQAVNQGGVIQGFNNGNQVTSSGITPLQIRGAPYQTTSSYQDNVAKAKAETATEEITVMKPHYSKNGEGPVLIEYVGSDVNNLTIKSGQEELLKQYPLTKEEYDLFKQDTSFSGDNDPEGPDTPTGSSTAWMDGIDFTSDANVEASAKEILEAGTGEGILGMGGPLLKGLSLIGAGNRLAKGRAIRDWAKANGKTSLAEKIDNLINQNVNKNVISLMDKFKFSTGKFYLGQINAKIEEEGIVIGGGVAPPTPPGSVKKPVIKDTSQDPLVKAAGTKKGKEQAALNISIDRDRDSGITLPQRQQNVKSIAAKDLKEGVTKPTRLEEGSTAGGPSKLRQRQMALGKIPTSNTEEDLATQINKGGFGYQHRRNSVLRVRVPALFILIYCYVLF